MLPAILVLLGGCPFISASLHESNDDPDDDTGQDTGADDTGVHVEPYECLGDRCTLYGPVTGTLALEPALEWTLSGEVQVGRRDAPASLQVSAGEEPFVVYMAPGSSLVVSPGSALEARGADRAPVVFTASAPIGSRAAGHWRGIELLGNAPVHCAGDVEPCVLASPWSGQPFGGLQSDEGSNLLEHVRIEFAGGDGTPALALAGLGSNNLLAGVQVHRSASVGVALRGGNASLSRVVVTGAAHSGVHVQNGWGGALQEAILHHYEGALGSGVSLVDEAYGSGTAVHTPLLNGLTIIGEATDDSGVSLGSNAHLMLYNTIVWRPGQFCLHFSDEATVRNGGASIAGTILYSCGVGGPLGGYATGPWGAGTNNNIQDPVIMSYYPLDPDYTLAEASLVRGWGVDVPVLGTRRSDPGAIDQDQDWTQGWTNYAED